MPARATETRIRDAYAWQLRRQGLSYAQIAEQVQLRFNEEAAALGGKPKTYSTVSAWRAVKRYEEELPPEAKHITRALSLERLDDLYRQTLRVLVATHYAYSTSGRVVIGPDGHPLLDNTVKLAAIARLQSLEESRRKLLGLDMKPAAATFSDDEAAELLSKLIAEEKAALPDDEDADLTVA
jgi:hypothetical protein